MALVETGNIQLRIRCSHPIPSLGGAWLQPPPSIWMVEDHPTIKRSVFFKSPTRGLSLYIYIYIYKGELTMIPYLNEN